jgi:hypothetical protein
MTKKNTILLLIVVLALTVTIIAPSILVYNVVQDIRVSRIMNTSIKYEDDTITWARKLAYLPWQRVAFGDIATYQITTLLHSADQKVLNDDDIAQWGNVINKMPIAHASKLINDVQYDDSTIRVYVLGMYDNFLKRNRNESFDDKEAQEIERIFHRAIWMGRSDSKGSVSYNDSDVEKWFQSGIRFMKSHKLNLVTQYSFEYAKFLSSKRNREKALDVLMDGKDFVGMNPDRDGSMLHELGMQLIKEYPSIYDVNILHQAIEVLTLAINCKRSAGNEIVPLYSRKFILEAKLRLRVRDNDTKELILMLQDYSDLISDMRKKISNGEISSVLWEVYLGQATVQTLLKFHSDSFDTCNKAIKIIDQYGPHDVGPKNLVLTFISRLPK